MSDVFLQDELRILGPRQGAAIQERVAQDAAIKAAIAIERERLAEVQAREEALKREALECQQAEVNAVAQLRSFAPLYEARQEAARQVIEAVSALWRIEQEIRAGLQLADRSLQSVEAYIDVTQRGAWRSALRDRAGLPARHIFNAPKQWIQNDGQRTGATVCAAITASIIGPDFIQVRNETVNFEI